MLNFNSILLSTDNPKDVIAFYTNVFAKKPEWAEADWAGFQVGGGFFSVYGELGELVKEKGDAVRASEKLATAGEQVYLEIRRGTDALDPAEWLERK